MGVLTCLTINFTPKTVTFFSIKKESRDRKDTLKKTGFNGSRSNDLNQSINQSLFSVVGTLNLRASLQVRHEIKIQNRIIKTSWKCI